MNEIETIEEMSFISKLKRRLSNYVRRLKLQLSGYVYVGDRIKEGWRNPLPHYAFKCPIHGLVEDYPHGYDDRLECPECRREEAKKNAIKIEGDSNHEG